MLTQPMGVNSHTLERALHPMNLGTTKPRSVQGVHFNGRFRKDLVPKHQQEPALFRHHQISPSHHGPDISLKHYCLKQFGTKTQCCPRITRASSVFRSFATSFHTMNPSFSCRLAHAFAVSTGKRTGRKEETTAIFVSPSPPLIEPDLMFD